MADNDARRSILEATLAIVAGDGVRAVTHRSVAERAGVSIGTTTYHFASRAEMLLAAYRHYLGELSGELAQLMPGGPIGGADDVVDLLVELLRREFADPGLVLVEYELYLAAARDPALAAELVAWERTVTGELAAAFEQLGAARPVEAARTVVNTVRGIELERMTRHVDVADVRRRLAMVVAGLCDGSPPDRVAATTTARSTARPTART